MLANHAPRTHEAREASSTITPRKGLSTFRVLELLVGIALTGAFLLVALQQRQADPAGQLAKNGMAIALPGQLTEPAPTPTTAVNPASQPVIYGSTSAQTPSDLMKIFAAKYPYAAGFIITRVLVQDHSPWQEITPDASISAFSKSATYVIDYRTTAGAGSAGFLSDDGATWTMHELIKP